MKRLVLSIALATSFTSAEVSAQLTNLSLETVLVHDGSIPEVPSGYTTYRIYAELTSELDFVLAVYGNSDFPLSVQCGGGSFLPSINNDLLVYNLGSQMNPLFFATFPVLEFDSWLTIGADDLSDGSNVNLTGEFLDVGDDLFGSGSGFVINGTYGGAVVNDYQCAEASDLSTCAQGNLAFAGEDNRVLLAQLTANGHVFGVLNVQVFVGGDQSVVQEATSLSFSSEPSEVFGCTDETACNYDSSATIDNFSCKYFDALGNCGGDCLYDLDDDGVCDPFNLLGCTNPVACNFLSDATVEDGSCDVIGEECDDMNDLTVNDVIDDNCACIGEAIQEGCIDEYACNFNLDAYIDDGSCIFPGDECDDGDDLTDNDVYTENCECVGILIAQPGCTDGSACNYSPNANVNDGSCLYFDALGECGGPCFSDLDGDGICDDLLGCENIGAAFWQDLELSVYSTFNGNLALIDSSNMDLTLTVGNEVHDSLSTQLVLNVPLVFVDEVTAGAFQVLSWSNLTAEGLPPGVQLILPQGLEGGSQACVELTGDDYPTQEGYYEVVITGEVLLNFFGTAISIGDVSSSFWVEVVSNPNGVPGCTYPTASNYMPWATYDSGVCEFTGCIDPSALNYSPSNSVDDGSCFYNDPNCVAESACPEDLNGDGAVGTPDLLLMLGEYGNFCD